MSEYKKIILKINKNLTSKHIITDIGSSKLKSKEVIKKNLKKEYFLDIKSSNSWIRSKWSRTW